MEQGNMGAHQHHHKTANSKHCRRAITPERLRRETHWEGSLAGESASEGS